MADVTLLHQEITLLKLRITALEHQRNNLESDLAVALAERDQADKANTALTTKLIKAQTDAANLEIEILRERRTSNAAMKKIEQLENELADVLSDDD